MDYTITIEQNGISLFKNTFTVADDSYREQLGVQVCEQMEYGVIDILISDGAISICTALDQMDPLVTIEKADSAWRLTPGKTTAAFPAAG